jgi:hypothetical protein
MPQITQDTASQIALEYVKSQKNTQKVDIALVEGNSGGWIIRGTCPIDLEGHQWAEKFEIGIDAQGKVKSAYFALL